MKKLAFSLALVVLALGRAQAQSADLSVELVVRPFAHALDSFFGDAVIRNLGPGVAHGVVVTRPIDGWPEAQLACQGTPCSLGDVGTLSAPFIPRMEQSLPVRDFTFTLTVTVSSDTPDPHPENNSATVTVHVSTAPQMTSVIVLPQ